MPIVPAAVVFDLGAGGSFANRPDADVRRAGDDGRVDAAAAPGHRRRRHRRPRRRAEGRHRLGQRRARRRHHRRRARRAQLRRLPGRPGDRRAVGRPPRAARRVPDAAAPVAGRPAGVPRPALAAARPGEPTQHDAGRRRHRRRPDEGRAAPASPAPGTTAWPGPSTRSTPTPTATSCSRWRPARRRCPTRRPTGSSARPSPASRSSPRSSPPPPTSSPAPSSTPRCAPTSAGTMRSYADQLPSAIRSTKSAKPSRSARRAVIAAVRAPAVEHHGDDPGALPRQHVVRAVVDRDAARRVEAELRPARAACPGPG